MCPSGIGTVVNVNISLVGNTSVDIAFDDGDAEKPEKLTLEQNGKRGGKLAAFEWMSAGLVLDKVDREIVAAQIDEHECTSVSHHHHLIGAQLLALTGIAGELRSKTDPNERDELADPSDWLQYMIDCFDTTARQYARAGTLREAATCATTVLAFLGKLPGQGSRALLEQESDLIYIIHRNWLVEDVQYIFEGIVPSHLPRMRQLVDALKPSPHEFATFICEWMIQFYSRKQEFHTCVKMGHHSVFMALDTGEDEKLMEAWRIMWMLHANKGEWATTTDYCELLHGVKEPGTGHGQKKLIYDETKHHENTFRYAGHDPGVTAWTSLALAQMKRCQPERARECIAEGIKLAKRLEHPLTLVLHSPCSKHGLPSDMMALITSGCG